MRQELAALVVAVAVAGGVGTGFAVHELRPGPAPVARDGAAPSPGVATPSQSATTSAAPAPRPAATRSPEPSAPVLLPVSALGITPGAVGPVSVGMGRDAAAGTGYLDTDVASSACGTVLPLAWKPDYGATLDVRTLADGTVDSIGVRAAGPRTRSGLQVGSTYAEVRQVVGPDAVPEEAGYGQAGLFVDDGSGWIGFLFDTPVDAVDDGDAVTFIEVTRGRRPGLQRDGC